MQPDQTVPPPAPTKKSSPVVWILVAVIGICFVCVAIGAAILFPVFAQAKLAAQMAATRTDLKLVGRAVLIYKTDFDDKFPPDTSTLSAAWPALVGYAKTSMPESKNPGHPEFSGNEKLGGVATSTIVSPAKTLEFFDSAPWDSSQQRMVLYVDSHVEKKTETDFQNALLNDMVEK